MKKTLKAKRCISEIFAQAYSISSRHTPETRNPVIVSRACGGCPVCRENGVTPFPGIMPAPSPVWTKPKFFVGEELQRLLLENNLMLIFYEFLEDKSKKRRINKVLKWFVEQGMRNIIIPSDLQETLIKEVNRIPNAFIFLWETYQPIKMPHIPTLIFNTESEKLPYNYLSKNSMSQAPRIIILPRDTPDPSRTDRRTKPQAVIQRAEQNFNKRFYF